MPCYNPCLISIIMTSIFLKHHRKWHTPSVWSHSAAILVAISEAVSFIYRKAESHARGVCYARLSRRATGSWQQMLRSSRSMPSWPSRVRHAGHWTSRVCPCSHGSYLVPDSRLGTRREEKNPLTQSVRPTAPSVPPPRRVASGEETGARVRCDERH